MFLKKRSNEIGNHVIIDFLYCDRNIINDNKKILQIIEQIISQMNIHVVKKIIYEFPKQGLTASFVLEESHLIIHTWPEHHFLSLDMYTCCDDREFDIETIQKWLHSRKHRIKQVRHKKV
jgi:S-adenosylmethionine decarboxylase proenzyme